MRLLFRAIRPLAAAVPLALLGAGFLAAPAVAVAQSGTSALITQVTAHGTWYFGRDYSSDDALVAQGNRANSNTAFQRFVAKLNGYGVQDFEGIATPATIPYSGAAAVSFAGSPFITGYLQDTETNLLGNSGQVRVVQRQRRFARSSVAPLGASDGTKLVQASDDMRLTFSSDNSGESVRAFGFFGVDVGDWNRDLTLRLGFSGAEFFVDDFAGNGQGSGSVFFLGFLANAGTSIATVDFDRSRNSGRCLRNPEACTPVEDEFGYDHFVVATDSQVGVVPEPSTYALMATGLVGVLGAARRRRRSA
jgi:hypothetical protein